MLRILFASLTFVAVFSQDTDEPTAESPITNKPTNRNKLPKRTARPTFEDTINESFPPTVWSSDAPTVAETLLTAQPTNRKQWRTPSPTAVTERPTEDYCAKCDVGTSRAEDDEGNAVCKANFVVSCGFGTYMDEKTNTCYPEKDQGTCDKIVGGRLKKPGRTMGKYTLEFTGDHCQCADLCVFWTAKFWMLQEKKGKHTCYCYEGDDKTTIYTKCKEGACSGQTIGYLF